MVLVRWRIAGMVVMCLASLVLAGCSSAPPASPTYAPPTATTASQAPAPVATVTDQLHLLARPSLTPRAPEGDSPLRVPIDSLYGQTVAGMGAASFADTWDYALPQGFTLFQGSATMFVEVQGTLVGDPIPTANGCFWALSVVAGPVQTGEFHDLGCIPEGLEVAAGQYRLDFPFGLTGVDWPAGTELHFELHTQEVGPRAPDAAATLLTAAAQHDSVLRIDGLQVPLDTLDGLLLA